MNIIKKVITLIVVYILGIMTMGGYVFWFIKNDLKKMEAERLKRERAERNGWHAKHYKDYSYLDKEWQN